MLTGGNTSPHIQLGPFPDLQGLKLMQEYLHAMTHREMAAATSMTTGRGQPCSHSQMRVLLPLSYLREASAFHFGQCDAGVVGASLNLDIEASLALRPSCPAHDCRQPEILPQPIFHPGQSAQKLRSPETGHRRHQDQADCSTIILQRQNLSCNIT